MTTLSEPIAIQEIGQETAKKILDSCDGTGGKYEPLGLFFLQEGDKFVGIDNSDGNAWTEEFPNKESCLRWLWRKDE